MGKADNMAKTYDPSAIESSMYKKWEEKGYFKGVVDHDKKPYTIVIPPPNITGQLHMGHALNNTLQDIIIRTKRMQGYSALWVPGTDHASIATEAKIVDAMAKEGVSKDDIGREGFLERAWAWKELYGNRIVNQLKCLGSSCDWERLRFTMDEGLSKAVLEVFIELYNKGLIYKGIRITNWCPKCNTSISDVEVEYEEQNGSFWHIKYPLTDGSGYLTIATTRPETMLGDTAVAVNPEDDRYKHLIGKTLMLPLVNKEIPIIADEYVELGFGTGAVKITPAHDPNDFEVGKRHNLPEINVMTPRGIINENGGKYEGMDRYEARAQIVKDLDELGLLVKIEPCCHNVGTCQRCGTVIEPIISNQWYVRMKPLAGPAIDAVKKGEIKFIPERFGKQYMHWMENIQDWCISRQLWWGHRIPAYYCQECGHIMVGRSMPDKCEKCGCSNIKQDEDTLDTWFSSALWPFSTLGWPDKTADLEYFYPTNVLVTAYDIIPFWVARMIFSGLEQMNHKPFDYVLIHGLIRDSQGRKMSKSLGNGIDPLEIIDQYGTDALRYALVTGNSPGNDQRFLIEKVEAARNFANKVWNATRFVLMNFDENPDFSRVDRNKFTTADKWILSACDKLIAEVTENINKFELGVALGKVYEFIWDLYCDWYIEIVKPRLFNQEDDTRLEAQFVLNDVLVKCMKLLHPFMPFITEELYQSLYRDSESIMISKWPEVSAENNYEQDEKDMEFIIEVIRTVRNIRQGMNVPPSKKAHLAIVVPSLHTCDVLTASKAFFERLASASDITAALCEEDIKDIDLQDAVTGIVANAKVYIPLNELVDFDKELERLAKEKETVESELKRVNSKLGNASFVSKAPEKVVAEEKAKLEKYTAMYESVCQRIEQIKSKL
ncbi:MAG: valine--tRNA ligase [Clostridia bacterium]|nr:valine--tRNA ligase [Clostridia bacterium]